MAGLPFIALCAFLVADQPRWTFGIRDAALWTFVGIAVIARVIDVEWFHGSTAEGEPATRRHAVVYAAGLVALVALLWLGGQSVDL
jgi:hypothetical protein